MTAVVASALPKTVEEVGAIAGIASFVLFLGLLALYVIRALELRRLKKTVPFLANPQNGNGQPENGRAGNGGRRAGA